MPLSRVTVHEILGSCDLESADLNVCQRSPVRSLVNSAVQVHYFGGYVRCRPRSANLCAIEHGGFETLLKRAPSTHSKHPAIDDSFGAALSQFPDPVMDKERFLSR